MNSSSKIMNDNLMYLTEWMKYNDSLKSLHIIGPHLICEIDGREESVDISNYYLPNILYNENLRTDIKDPNKIAASDLFRIIRLNVLAAQLQQDEETPELLITSFQILKDVQGNDYIVLEDSQGKKYKLSQHISDIHSIYQALLAENTVVPFVEFKKRLEGIKK